MKVDIWSDIACPFCYIGKTQFDKALDEFAHKGELEVTYHSFQLDPMLPRDYDGTVHEMLGKKLGKTAEEAKSMNDSVSKQADGYDLSYDMDKLVVTKTEDAHRLIHFASQKGKQSEMINRIYKAYFSEGKHVGDFEVLADLAAEVGLDRDEALSALEGDDYRQDVTADMEKAASLGIRGVPFYVINEKYGLSGAQGEKVFLEALQKAWHEANPLEMVGSSDAATCVDGVCAVPSA